ncbi:hypothetical protein [Lysobacter gummosus]|uniref:hypothetical protein n=1 Tax=Lysobacter gummosus TaxID=262324 RepID=UPI003633E5EF
MRPCDRIAPWRGASRGCRRRNRGRCPTAAIAVAKGAQLRSCPPSKKPRSFGRMGELSSPGRATNSGRM